MRFSLFAQASVLGLAVAAPLDSYYAVKETHYVPDTFTRIGDAPPEHRIRLSLGLTQSRFEELERHLWEVSDPDHHRYGQHLTQDEVNELVKPTEEASQLVHEWLLQHVHPDDIDYSSAGDYLHFTMSIADIERLLDTQFHRYVHEDGTEMMRTTQWSLPVHLHEHITTIQPTTSFMRPRPQAKHPMIVPGSKGLRPFTPNLKPNELADISKICNVGSVTPNCLRALYGTINYKPQAGNKNQIALNDFLGEINNRSDAALYLKTFRPGIVSAAYAFKQVSVNGGTTQQTPENATQLKDFTGIEGGLDVQTIIGITNPVPVTAYSTGGSPPFIPDSFETTDGNEPWLTWLNYILKQKNIPFQTLSNSYADDEQTVPESYAKSVCSSFAQLGARGVTVFVGSGDGGVSGVQAPGSCKSNVNGKKIFVPLFPSSCPYVTSVGATVNIPHEVVAYDPRNGFVSGGGFSNYFAQPRFQSKAVAAYLKTFTKYSNLYNSSGRAYPDLAAYGVNFTIAWDGQLFNVDGTSASTPTTASVFSLVNDKLIAAGKSPLGWVNPFLYSKAYSTFTDVVHGNTMGCNTTGFTAAKGWDAASGWGTPNFGPLSRAAGVSA